MGDRAAGTTLAAPPVPATAAERAAYADETVRLAEDLWRYVFPPWRWFEWHRRKKLVDERMIALRAVRDFLDERRSA